MITGLERVFEILMIENLKIGVIYPNFVLVFAIKGG